MTVAQAQAVTTTIDTGPRSPKVSSDVQTREPAPKSRAANAEILRDPVAEAEKTVAELVAKDLPINQRLSIERDESSSRAVFRAIDRESGETVKQFPTEETLRAIRSLRDVAGLGLDVDA